MKKLAAAALSIFVVSAVSASAADLGPRTYAKAPVMMAPINWTGFYVGVNAGGAWNTSNATTATVFSPTGYFALTSVPAIAIAGNQNINRSGFTGGLTAGYNWQASNWVVGIESDFNYFGVKGSTSATALYPCCAPTNFTVNSSVSASGSAYGDRRAGGRRQLLNPGCQSSNARVGTALVGRRTGKY